MLEPLGISPTRIREDGVQIRGYLRAAFEPHWPETRDVSQPAQAA